MNHSIIVVSDSDALPTGVTLPDGFDLQLCADPHEVRHAMARGGRDVVLLCGTSAATTSAAAIREHAPRAVLVAVSDEEVVGVDVVVRPAAGPRELCRILRYVSGHAMRRSVRVSCTGAVVITSKSGTTEELELVDISEDGICARPAPAQAIDEASVTLFIDGEHRLQAQVREVRRDRASGAVVMALVTPTTTQRAMLRTLTTRGTQSSSDGPRKLPRGASQRMLGSSPAMIRAIDTLERVAPTDVTVLVLGETGTGKELAARLVHDGSPRANEPFVAVNCAALPESLVESELFGHEPGAFTGAVKRRIGRIEQAHRGSLFLDEIGDLPAGAQAKLLRALQERVIERVGGTDTVRVDFRLVAATNRDLSADIANRAFRRDLFYRLSVVTVRLPALRERTGDVPLLARHFLESSMRRLNRRGIRLSEHALARMAAYPWPGNVRELENLCTRLVALASSDAILGPEHLGLMPDAELIGSPLPSTDLRDILDFCEREIVRRMLERHGGNRTRTAGALGISRQALQQKLARFVAAESGGDVERGTVVEATR
jgi:DNA-binding NtrC family response regulator